MPQYPNAQKEMNKTVAYAGGKVSAFEGKVEIHFKAKKFGPTRLKRTASRLTRRSGGSVRMGATRRRT